jgi:hypothetical protein
MLLSNYNIPTHSYVPQEIFEYTDNERLLLILFGNVVIQTMKTNISLNNNAPITEEAVIKEITDKYSTFLKEKEDTITELEIQKRMTIELYNDLLNTERAKRDAEVQKEVLKEKQHIDEKLLIMKESYERDIFSLKTEKENMSQQIESLKYVEKEHAILEEKLKNTATSLKDILENERNTVFKELTDAFQTEKDGLKEEILSLKSTISSYDNTVNVLKIEKEVEILRTENEYRTKQCEQIESLQRENGLLKMELQGLINQREKERFDLLTKNYENKENAMTELQKTVEEIRLQTSKSAVSQDKGKVGEMYFFELVNELFQDIDGFEIEDKTKVGHMGDFLMKFKEGFSIMVDCKNFNKSKVGTVDIKKFKADIKSNQHIRFAWMVSLNRGISSYDKYPVQTEFENGVLYCYMNTLLSWGDNQRNILISCWLFCKEIYLNFFDKENGDAEKIITLMKRDNNKKLIAERGRRKIKEMKNMNEQLKVTIYDLEKDLIEIIKGDVLMQNEDRLISLKNWWGQSLIWEESKKNKIEIEVLYDRFKQTLDEFEQADFDYDSFILNLKTFVKEDDFTKNKTKGSKKCVLNYKWVV